MTPDPASRTHRLEARRFDVLVIGGGITGCGIARDAALRGLSVALVEKNDFASGTSSRSSRLIHGGVRYLENAQLHLVFEASAERRRLLRLAPHLVHPLAFTWPVYAGARIPRWKLGAGLTLYDALALFRNVERHHRLGRDRVLEDEPNVRRDGLRGGARYFDAATNDARLTLANALGAADAGAVVVNHAEVESLRFDDTGVIGATVRDTLRPGTAEVNAAVVVNATGPWSNDLRRLDGDSRAAVRGSKGVHIEVPRDRVGNRGALTLIAPQDGRVFFVLPAEEHAIIGTTDTYTDAGPDEVRATSDDVAYLLEAANHFFPSANLTTADVVSAWAGIRPLIAAGAATPGGVSREHAVDVSEHGLISITGGKLTTYRVMARDVMRVVARQLGRRLGRERTASVPLPGGDFTSMDRLVASAARDTGDVALAAHLARTYGTRWTHVWSEIQRPGGNAPVVAGLPYTLGELRHAVRHEMARTLGDLLVRRTHLAFETRDHGLEASTLISSEVAPLLGWTPSERELALADYEREIARVFSVE
ncbi:MAG TPA: glycerol-3-phosphate dehydrogenase [Gemmatimonadaceae bacterium]|nr:glycerol-3-phosphate dehydrogenase [Gemmatimonadaceae bacterium]